MFESKYPKPKTPQGLLEQGCDRPWEVDIEPFRVSPNVYYVGNTWVGGYLVRTDEGLILIDSTMHSQVYLIFEAIRKLGFDPKDIKLLLCTHGHYDHIGAVRPIAEYSGATIYMSKEEEVFITETPDLMYTCGYSFGSFEVDEYFADNKPITLGGITIRTEFTPGHTPGTTSMFIEDRDTDGKTYVVGLHGGVGLGTVSDRYFEETGQPASLRDDYLAGLTRLRDRHVDIAIASHPAHVGLLDKIAEDRSDFSPFVDSSAWGAFIDERVELLKQMTGGT